MHVAPALIETQRRFLAALYDDNEAGPLDAIDGNGLDPQARLRIYRHSCDAIQNGALRTVYPAVLALVGEAFFDQTAHGYRAAYPSRTGNLHAFGDHLADYLAGLPSIRELAYLPDVARLEWLRQESALAADTPAWQGPASARTVQPAHDRLKTVLHPGVRLLASRHAVLTTWRYAMQPTDKYLELPPTGENVILWRDDGQVAMAALDRASFACVESLARGNTFADAYQAGRKQDLDFDFAACIASLVDRGLLAAHVALD